MTRGSRAGLTEPMAVAGRARRTRILVSLAAVRAQPDQRSGHIAAG